MKAVGIISLSLLLAVASGRPQLVKRASGQSFEDNNVHKLAHPSPTGQPLAKSNGRTTDKVPRPMIPPGADLSSMDPRMRMALMMQAAQMEQMRLSQGEGQDPEHFERGEAGRPPMMGMPAPFEYEQQSGEDRFSPMSMMRRLKANESRHRAGPSPMEIMMIRRQQMMMMNELARRQQAAMGGDSRTRPQPPSRLEMEHIMKLQQAMMAQRAGMRGFPTPPGRRAEDDSEESSPSSRSTDMPLEMLQRGMPPMSRPDMPSMDRMPPMERPDMPPMRRPNMPPIRRPDMPSIDRMPPLERPDMPPMRSPDMRSMTTPEMPPMRRPDMRSMKRPEIPPMRRPDMLPMGRPDMPPMGMSPEGLDPRLAMHLMQQRAGMAPGMMSQARDAPDNMSPGREALSAFLRRIKGGRDEEDRDSSSSVDDRQRALMMMQLAAMRGGSDEGMMSDPRMRGPPMMQDPRMQESPMMQDPRMRGPPMMQDLRMQGSPMMQNPRMQGSPMMQDPRMRGPPMMQDPRIQESSMMQDPRMRGPPMMQDPRMQGSPMMQNPRMQGSPMMQDPRMHGAPMMQDPRIQESSMMQDPRMRGPPMMQDPRMQGSPMMQNPRMQGSPMMQDPRMHGALMMQDPRLQGSPMMQDPRMWGSPMMQDPRMQRNPMMQDPSTQYPPMTPPPHMMRENIMSRLNDMERYNSDDNEVNDDLASRLTSLKSIFSNRKGPVVIPLPSLQHVMALEERLHEARDTLLKSFYTDLLKFHHVTDLVRSQLNEKLKLIHQIENQLAMPLRSMLANQATTPRLNLPVSAPRAPQPTSTTVVSYPRMDMDINPEIEDPEMMADEE